MFNEILSIIKELLPLVKGIIAPEDWDRYNKRIRQLEEKKDAQTQEFLKALDAMDVPTLNRLFSELISIM